MSHRREKRARHAARTTDSSAAAREAVRRIALPSALASLSAAIAAFPALAQEPLPPYGSQQADQGTTPPADHLAEVVITGVQINRTYGAGHVGGEGSSINIRGLPEVGTLLQMQSYVQFCDATGAQWQNDPLSAALPGTFAYRANPGGDRGQPAASRFLRSTNAHLGSIESCATQIIVMT